MMSFTKLNLNKMRAHTPPQTLKGCSHNTHTHTQEVAAGLDIIFNLKANCMHFKSNKQLADTQHERSKVCNEKLRNT